MQLKSSKSLLRDQNCSRGKKIRFNEIVFFSDDLLYTLIMGFERFSLFQLPLILVKILY